jgi:5-methylcytosine-specific restriction endonuclease McrA
MCHYCGDQATTRDHTTPKSKGGRNTVPACLPCNKAKADLPYGDFMLIVKHGLLSFVKNHGGKKALRHLNLEELRKRET